MVHFLKILVEPPSLGKGGASRAEVVQEQGNQKDSLLYSWVQGSTWASWEDLQL